ncbi:MAG: hypothetical protein JSU70_11435, partial [Phycisphaerales bacterium]
MKSKFLSILALAVFWTPCACSGANPGLTGHFIRILAVDHKNPHTVYAGIADGVVAKSTDGGANWTLVDTGQTPEPITALAIHPTNTDIVYASGFTAGFIVAKSTNGGLDWTNPFESCAATLCGALGFPALAVDLPDVVYAGARGGKKSITKGVGMFISLDGAKNWTPSNMPGVLVQDVEINPLDSSVIYAAASNGSVYKSIDSGVNWEIKNTGLTSYGLNALAIDSNNPSTVYVGGSGGIFKTTDGGENWTPKNEGMGSYLVDSIAIDPDVPRILYVGTTHQGCVFKSTDGAENWTLINNGLTERTIQHVAIDPHELSTVYAGTEDGVYKTVDGGATWVSPPAAPPVAKDHSTAGYRNASTGFEPINIFTGELFSFKPRDLDLGGPMPLYFQRYYASYLRRSYVVGDLGSNWRHNFDAWLYWSGNTITYVSYDGRVTEFLQDLGTGDWDQLTNTDTPYQLSAEGGQDAKVYDPESDRIYTFDYTTGDPITGKLIRIEDGHGNVHTVTYDLANGQIETVSDGLGRTLTFTYNSDATPKISEVSDGTRSVSFQYTDPIDTEYLTLVTDALLGVTQYSYKDTSGDADHALMTSMTRPAGNVPYTQTFFGTSSPASGRVATQTDGNGNTFSLDYSGLETTLTDPLGNTSVQTHTATGEFNSREDEAGLTIALGSDATGRRNSITDRLGDTTTYDYNMPSGNISNVTNADGTTSDFSYTQRLVGDLTLYDLTGITHADGTTESLIYDAMGNVTSYTDQIGNTATATYNANGQPLTNTNVAGATTTHAYNVDATLATTTDPAGNTTTYGYDGLKRLDLITFADGNTASFTYNDHDQPLTTTDGNGETTTMTYDGNGNLVSTTDPLGNTTTFGYDDNDRPLNSTDPLGGIVSRTYSPLGKVATFTDENSNTTIFGYDILG